jgi:hypothetical protein
MCRFEPLLTMNTTDISALHTAYVTHGYPQVMLPIFQGITASLTPLTRRQDMIHYRAFSKFH